MRRYDFLLNLDGALRICRFSATKLHKGTYGLEILIPIETDEQLERGVSYDHLRKLTEQLGFELMDESTELLNEPDKLYDYYAMMTDNETLYKLFYILAGLR